MEVKFADLVNIYEREVRLNTKNKHKIYRFERFKMENLTKAHEILLNNNKYIFKYNVFMIKSPKYRIVMSLDIIDKVINHYVTRYILMPKLEKYLDIRNVATRKNMGKDYGIKLLKKYLEHFKTKEACYVLKIDLSKYFYSIDHSVLKSMLIDRLSNDEYRIICDIIDSTNENYINDLITKLKAKELLRIKARSKEVEEIPLYHHGKGLPIGNMSSQFLSVFYLSSLDHKIIHDYKLKYYVRYMDNVIILSDNKDYLKHIKMLIEKELQEKYLLKFNNKKTNLLNVKNGFNFCGYRFRIINKKTVINVSASTRVRVKKRIKEIKHLYKTKSISLHTAFSSYNTYYNGFKYGSKKRLRRLVDKNFFG